MRLFIGLIHCLLPFMLGAQPKPVHNLEFKQIPARWDEGLPLGNGLLGCLVWQKDGNLRLALDRADLWDERPMAGLDRPEFSYQWVAKQVAKQEYGIVQEYFDAPYEREAGPTKLPGGALEFGISDAKSSFKKASLDLSTGLGVLDWTDGRRFETFIHASRQEGWFRCKGFEDLKKIIQLQAPAYAIPPESGEANSVQGSDLARLGYPQSEVLERDGVWLFHQSGWKGFSYEIAVTVRKIDVDSWEGVWSISSHFPQAAPVKRAEINVKKAIRRGFDASFNESKKWWMLYWAKSSVAVPNPLIERQYYRELYKLGCTARSNGPMISLQAVWTADNGRLPPWKGDLHHDLNTQLSYWPVYTSNHLSSGLSYLRHLESNELAHLDYTRRYFGTSGLNVPGVSTLLGREMGGWIQYSCSPTVSAWLSQHFYLHWRYSQDRTFLKKHAWPWLRETAVHLNELTLQSPPFLGKRVLPLSSSPEIGDNGLNAWFPNTWTNYDLALARFVFEKTAELATEMNLLAEAEKWRQCLRELPDFALEPDGALMFAPTLAYRESHRHFSHLMAIHPLGLLSPDQDSESTTIQQSLKLLDSIGPSAWCGYSYAWLANLRARARDGEGAAEALRIFAEAFVSPNSFHLNGDQSGKGYSSFTYRPFTLEGNFAFAAGLQEMLLQSHGGVLRVFPAVPDTWKLLSFKDLRAEGAFLVSAEFGKSVEVFAEQGGELRVELPAGNWVFQGKNAVKTGKIWRIKMKKGARARWVLAVG
jgi:alpha-L-fucosidase 2